MITSLLDSIQGENPDFLIARNHTPEPSSVLNERYNFYIAPKLPFNFEQSLKDGDKTLYEPIQRFTFVRTLIALPGVTFYAWKSAEDNKLYI